MDLYTKEYGRPTNCQERLEKEVACYDLLDELEVEYLRIDHPAAMTMDDCVESDKLLGIDTCKNLFLCNRQKTQFYLLAIRGDLTLKTKDLAKQLGTARLSFANYEFMEEFLHITPGSVSVLGLMNDHENRVQLVMDKSATEQDAFACHPCINTSSLKFSMSDLMEKILPKIHHQPIFVDLSQEEA